MEKIKLSDICNPKQWKTIPTSELLEDGYPVYGANGIIGYYREFNHENPVVAVTCRGATCGSINITVPKSYVTGNAMCLDDVRNDIEMEYLYYCLKQYDFNNVISGSAQPQITRQGMDKIYITVCTHDEQISIVDELKKVERVIELRKQELQSLDELIKARFIEMFGDLANLRCSWRKCMLIEACVNKDDIKCGPFGTQLSKEEYTDVGIAVWEIPQINSAFVTKPVHFLSKKKAEDLNAYTIISGDIAMSRKGNVGKCAVFPDDYPDGIIHSDVLRIRVDSKKVNSIFMMCQLHYSREVTRQIEMVSSGAIMAGINVTKLKQIYVHIPPLKLQEQFADFVHQVDKSKIAVKKALDEAQLLFDSLMQQFFGEK